jgi:uncharacterized membrane protein
MRQLDITPPPTPAPEPTDSSGPATHSRTRRFSTVGLTVGTLLFACSLTPSLLPRTAAFQGLVSGLSLSLGYALGRFGAWLWSYLELPIPNPRQRRVVMIAAAAICGTVAAAFLARATGWQNSVRAIMGMDEASDVRPLSVALIALLVFAVLHFVGWQLRRTVLFLTRTFKRIVPQRIGTVIGILAVGALFWMIADGIIFAVLLRATDKSFEQLDALIEDELGQPTDPVKTGSAASLIAWQDLGRQGRSFVSSGPTPAEISAFHGAIAREPIRVYVGLNAAETPRQRASLALRELIRVGAFERSVLLLVTPTGTGWVDPASLNPVEYMHRGNVATVAAQYSYLPSVLALTTEAPNGAEMARALFQEVYGYWTRLPSASRPKLYLHGVSLGALNSDLSFDLYDVLRDPFHGVLWVGPPFRSRSWNRITASRDPKSPVWLPRFRDGSVVRFANQNGGLQDGSAAWGPLRIAYLQYGSDPVTFFSARSFFRKPEWLRIPRAPDVSPEMRWYPGVTMVQLAADLVAGTDAVPLGYGHNFAPRHYIDAWLALTEPAGWTGGDTRRLKALFAAYQR